jgi:hypothetical protein
MSLCCGRLDGPPAAHHPRGRGLGYPARVAGGKRVEHGHQAGNLEPATGRFGCALEGGGQPPTTEQVPVSDFHRPGVRQGHELVPPLVMAVRRTPTAARLPSDRAARVVTPRSTRTSCNRSAWRCSCSRSSSVSVVTFWWAEAPSTAAANGKPVTSTATVRLAPFVAPNGPPRSWKVAPGGRRHGPGGCR